MSDERAHKLGIMETPIDRLSALPDSIIIHILSLLGDDVKKAAATSVLSKRWQFIWSEMPRLHFIDRSLEIEKKRDFVSWVRRTLLLRSSGTHLESFQINFFQEGFVSDLNAFIRFALRSKVKELSLMLHSSARLYKLPQVLYSDSSLRYLHVQNCILAPRGTIEWRSMTDLCIEGVDLDDHVIHKVISGCPVLRTLEMSSCWRFERLDLDSESLDMLKLASIDGLGVAPLLEISAPYLRTLYIWFNPVYKKIQLTKVPSLINVDISFYDSSASVEMLNYTMELFEKIRHVKDLTLRCCCVEVLSELVVHGQRLPQSRRHYLGLDITRGNDNIPGILGLLESSPNLDTLLIECAYCSEDFFLEPGWLWEPIARDDLVCDLLNLKTVRLVNYADPNLGGEPMITMARILLKRAPALELMMIDSQDNLIKFPSEVAKISQTVLSYPKSSQKAEIVLRM